jgi:hypothetical protein
MLEVRRVAVAYRTKRSLTRNKQGDHTTNGEYENIYYHIFPAVKHDRLLPWKAGFGSIILAVEAGVPQKTNADRDGVLVPAGHRLFVHDTEIKLVKKFNQEET